ncbi:MAG: replication-relaxation family protein [Acidimicrobiia bacterium]|nr:replication-relaxation family protein [Acidimicrobiia bacterium]
MSVTGRHAGPARRPNRDSLHSLRADAIWTALPARDQHLLLWLLSADIVTSRLAALLVYGQLRIAQRRLSRLVELGLLRGFWAAGAQRPRGRYAYVLTRAARSEIERLAWPEGRSDRPVDTPASAPVHQLATLDLLVAFLRAGDPRIAEGLAIWIPERACGYLFGGLLRPDAVAGIRVGDRALTLFVERDLGTERGEALADKLRRYRSIISRIGPDGVRVGFVVPSPRRARAILDMAGRLGRECRSLPRSPRTSRPIRWGPGGSMGSDTTQSGSWLRCWRHPTGRSSPGTVCRIPRASTLSMTERRSSFRHSGLTQTDNSNAHRRQLGVELPPEPVSAASPTPLMPSSAVVGLARPEGVRRGATTSWLPRTAGRLPDAGVGKGRRCGGGPGCCLAHHGQPSIVQSTGWARWASLYAWCHTR